MKILLSVKYGDLKEMKAGTAAIVSTLGWAEGARAMLFATRKHMEAIRRGEGLYPEQGKQRVWFKLHYLKNVYDYLKTQNGEGADERFASIAKGPALQFIGNVIPPSHCLTRDYILHHLWEDMIAKDTNIIAEACPPKGNAASMRVTRCFINEVSRDIGLLPVANRLCNADYLFWENYHPNITFSRTRTLVGGDLFCDHTVTWKA